MFFQPKLFTSNMLLTDLKIATDLVLTNMKANSKNPQAHLLAGKLKKICCALILTKQNVLLGEA